MIAKDVLWLHFTDLLSVKLIGRNSTLRSKQDVNVYVWWYSASLAHYRRQCHFKMPKFVAIKLDRLLHYDPEETNIFSIIDRLSIVEQMTSAVRLLGIGLIHVSDKSSTMWFTRIE